MRSDARTFTGPLVVSHSQARRVMIVERRLTHYRLPLYERLRTLLSEQGIDLMLLVGQETPQEATRQDRGHLPWALVLPTQYLLSGAVCWQPFGKYLRDADLVIVNHQNKLLYNHWLLLRPRHFRLGLWGHARNMQARSATPLRDRLRCWSLARADWYFAYTQLTVDALVHTGFPPARITTLNNTSDTDAMGRDRAALSPSEVTALKTQLSIDGMPVGVFVGSLYRDKRLDFLFEACRRVRQRMPLFQCVILGDGPERVRVEGWAATHSWVHWVGARRGRAKALYLTCADLMLNPGAVGLGIIDSFAFGVPLVTTDCGIHGPEIAYLRPGENGAITADDIDAFAATVARLLSDPPALARMRDACLASARAYSLENMASRFVEGVSRALASPPRALSRPR